MKKIKKKVKKPVPDHASRLASLEQRMYTYEENMKRLQEIIVHHNNLINMLAKQAAELIKNQEKVSEGGIILPK